ncbi:TPA: GNAT family N-acetyltransferase, partial [Escherichia coli]
MLKLVEYDRTFLDLSMKWLSDPEIASLVMVPSFTKVQQECFFNSLPTRENYYIKGLIYNGYPIGAAGIKNIYKEKGEYWGYIGEKQFWGKGIGKDIIRLIINNAKILGL